MLNLSPPWGVSEGFYGEVTSEMRSLGRLRGGRALQAVGIVCAKERGRHQHAASWGCTLHHDKLLRMNTLDREGGRRKHKVLQAPFNTTKLPHQAWTGSVSM